MSQNQQSVIVDYGVGNVRSIARMLLHLGVRATVTGEPDAVARADRLFLPGVGAWDAAAEQVRRGGLAEALRVAAIDRAVPTLGLCLGMQLLFETGAEGGLPGLGFLKGSVVRIKEQPGLRVPHMGWNDVTETQAHPMWNSQKENLEYADLDAASQFYFVHSYKVQCADALVLGTTHHGAPFPSLVAQGNVVGAQFHPEKSHRYGMRFFTNFLSFQP
jgi:imidazole glycerol-phosphate synthase subunit HisH